MSWIELPPEDQQRRGLLRAGFAPRAERAVNIGLACIVAVFAVAWSYVVAEAYRTGESPAISSRITAPVLSADAPPETAFLLDAALRVFAERAPYRGESGEVRVVIAEPGDTSLPLPDSLPAGVDVAVTPAEGDTTSAVPTSIDAAERTPGIWNVVLGINDALRRVPDMSVISLVPLTEKRGGRIGSYLIGSWPYESGGKPSSDAYLPPVGLVRVTPENQDLQVSRHFRLRDFLTKGQENVWPKYVAMSPRLLDKLELTIQEMGEMGHPVQQVGIISGFRTPQYNEGGGNTGGRGALSRHMYGDAMDFYIDNDRDGRMDDLNGDGRVDIGDARVLAEAADRVEREHPTLIGGIGIYRPTGAHSGFVHVDTRGYRARW